MLGNLQITPLSSTNCAICPNAKWHASCRGAGGGGAEWQRRDWHPRMPDHLDDEELADWRAGRNAVYQFAALTIGARLGGRRRVKAVREKNWSCVGLVERH
ncbi:MAG: hypothetical protein WB611_17825 [Stellaceae bacterium]